MDKRSQLVVLGIMGQMPLAGVLWQFLHYLEGFSRLGFDVYYVEDTGAWPYDPELNTITDDCTRTVDTIGWVMTTCGLSDRWAYRAATDGGRTFGLSESEVQRLFRRADVLVNVTGSTVLRDEHLRVPVRVYLETDPVLPQIEVAKGTTSYLELLGSHTHHCTFGENLGTPDCDVPLEHFYYRRTRQPIVIDWWRPENHAAPLSTCFTTIANWRQTSKDIEWNGQTYTWSKHQQFLKFIDLPSRTTQPLELALALSGHWEENEKAWAPQHQEDAEAICLLASHGWRIINGLSLSTNINSYREYIRASRGEFTVAKEQYVRPRSGWFSDRSASTITR